MAIVNLESEYNRTLEATINWAKTNKGYSDMRDLFVGFLADITNNQVYKKGNVVGRYFLEAVPTHLKRDAAPSLTKAQQHKLSVILRRITALIPKPEPQKSQVQAKKSNKS